MNDTFWRIAAATGNTPSPTIPEWALTGGMLVLLVVVFYFFILRPQKKQEKQTNEMLNNLQVGDEITTVGGIIGRVVSIKEETVLIETSKDKTKIRLLKTSVRSVDVKAEDAQK